MTPTAKTRDPLLAAATRAKTLALMSHPPRPADPKPRGHREWMVSLAERKAR